MEKIADKKNSQMGILTNVRVRVLDKYTHKTLEEHKVSNNVTKRALQGIVKFLDGQFNASMLNYFDELNNYIPRFVALGTNATTEPTVQDTRLNNEFIINGVKQRIKINNSDILSQHNTKYVTLTFRTYISDHKYDTDNNPYNEFGLFCDETKNTLWARVKLDSGVYKTPESILELMWEITVIAPSSDTDSYRMSYNYEISDEDNHIHTFAVFIEGDSLYISSSDESEPIYIGQFTVNADSTTGLLSNVQITTDDDTYTLYTAE